MLQAKQLSNVCGTQVPVGTSKYLFIEHLNLSGTLDQAWEQ